jgi:hypothetical protein
LSRGGSLAFAMLIAFSACRGLPSMAPGVCGNGVVDANESCDMYGRGEASCRAPGVAEACHLDCTTRTDGSRPACPSGWGCDVHDVCREATGSYDTRAQPIGGNAFSLLAGDFDGDGRADILSRQPPGLLGSTTFRVQFFDRTARPTMTWKHPTTVLSLAVDDVSADGRADVVAADVRLSVFYLPNTQARLLGPMADSDVSQGAALMILAEDAGQLTFAHPDEERGVLRVTARLDGSIDTLAGTPSIGQLFDDSERHPCADIALAIKGESTISIVSACERDEGQTPQWRSDAEVSSVTLEPLAAIEQGPIVADIDGDRHLDLVIGTDHGAYVSYGNGMKLTAAKPWLAAQDGDLAQPMPVPLVAADFTGDGAADLVPPTASLTGNRSSDSVGRGPKRTSPTSTRTACRMWSPRRTAASTSTSTTAPAPIDSTSRAFRRSVRSSISRSATWTAT